LRIDIEGIATLKPYTEEQVSLEPWRRVRSWAINAAADIVKVECLIPSGFDKEEFKTIEYITSDAKQVLNAFLAWVAKKREQLKHEEKESKIAEKKAGVVRKDSAPLSSSTNAASASPSPPQLKKKGSFFSRSKKAGGKD